MGPGTRGLSALWLPSRGQWRWDQVQVQRLHLEGQALHALLVFLTAGTDGEPYLSDWLAPVSAQHHWKGSLVLLPWWLWLQRYNLQWKLQWHDSWHRSEQKVSEQWSPKLPRYRHVAGQHPIPHQSHAAVQGMCPWGVFLAHIFSWLKNFLQM